MNLYISSSKDMWEYLKSLLLALGSFIMFVIFINVLVDPFDSFDLIEIVGFNATKHTGDSRVAKALSVTEKKYDVLIFGSSRSEIGLDPAHSCWGDLSVYNLSLPATNMYETYHVFDYTMAYQQPKTILLSLDFLMFTDRRATNRDFHLSRFDQPGFFISTTRELLGIYALKESINTVNQNLMQAPGLYKSGFRDGKLVFSDLVDKIGHRQLFWNAIGTNFLINSQTYRGYRYSSERVNMLRNIINTCLGRGINVIIVIPPIHALQLETIHSINLWPVFERWKRDLTKIISGANSERKIPVYDFTSWKGRVAESLPKDIGAKMQWFWEASHFKKELGDLVLNRVLGCSTLNQYGKDFGIMLTQNSIDKHLQRMRTNRMDYIINHQLEIRELASLFMRNGLHYE